MSAECAHPLPLSPPITASLWSAVERWTSGWRNARQLWRELATQGDAGSSRTVARLTGYLRRKECVGEPLPTAPAGSMTPA
jgi:hypothetical protein